MDTILCFTHSEKRTMDILEELAEELHLYGIPYTINYRDMTMKTEDYKMYAVSSSSALIGTLPGFRYYLNETTQEEFNKRVRFKLLECAMELKSVDELFELLKMPIF